MPADGPTAERSSDGRRPPLSKVVLLFLRLGLTAFGGPAAYIAIMENEVVRRRGWGSRTVPGKTSGAKNTVSAGLSIAPGGSAAVPP